MNNKNVLKKKENKQRKKGGNLGVQKKGNKRNKNEINKRGQKKITSPIFLKFREASNSSPMIFIFYGPIFL